MEFGKTDRKKKNRRTEGQIDGWDAQLNKLTDRQMDEDRHMNRQEKG
jgi:hypothetical protein